VIIGRPYVSPPPLPQVFDHLVTLLRPPFFQPPDYPHPARLRRKLSGSGSASNTLPLFRRHSQTFLPDLKLTCRRFLPSLRRNLPSQAFGILLPVVFLPIGSYGVSHESSNLPPSTFTIPASLPPDILARREPVSGQVFLFVYFLESCFLL